MEDDEDIRYMNDEFFQCCSLDFVDDVKELIVQGVDPSCDENKGIATACSAGSINVLKYLLSLDVSKGVDPNVCSINNYLSWFAIEDGHEEINSFTLACGEGQLDVVKILLELDDSRKMDPRTDNNYPFIHACKYGQLEIVQFLLSLKGDQQIDPSTEDNKAFHYTCIYKDPEIARLLLSLDSSRGIDPSSRNYMGFLTLEIPDQELFLDFINHPKFYDGAVEGILPDDVSRKISELSILFFEELKRAKPSYSNSL